MKIVYIYEILDSTNSPVYVGKAENVDARINSHVIRSKKGESRLSKWIRSQKTPLPYRIVANCTENNVNQVERHFISKRLSEGNELFNMNKREQYKNYGIKINYSDRKDYGISVHIPFTMPQMESLYAISTLPTVVQKMELGQFNEKIIDLIQREYKNQIELVEETK